MAKLRCEGVSPGLRASEAIVSFSDVRKRRHFLRVERDFLSAEPSGEKYLPVGIVSVDFGNNLVLIELPHEAETGANRIWVREQQLDEPVGARV